MWKRELRNNKLVSGALLLISAAAILIDGDGTILLLTVPLGFGLFFSKQNWVHF